MPDSDFDQKGGPSTVVPWLFFWGIIVYIIWKGF